MSIYVKSAKKIIKGVRVVGITGSYGKTSSKNILYDLIGDYLNVIKTPKSFNKNSTTSLNFFITSSTYLLYIFHLFFTRYCT